MHIAHLFIVKKNFFVLLNRRRHGRSFKNVKKYFLNKEL